MFMPCDAPPGRPWPPATPCFRRSRLMFQVFDLDVAKVYLRCCIHYNDNIRMLQAYVAKADLGVTYTCTLQEYVLSVLDVSYVCCKCFI
jgi:hypothetical protein